MSMPISPPAEFNTQAYGARWFTWAEMEACFWPGKGNRSESVHAELAKIMNLGGVYLLGLPPLRHRCPRHVARFSTSVRPTFSETEWANLAPRRASGGSAIGGTPRVGAGLKATSATFALLFSLSEMNSLTTSQRGFATGSRRWP